MVAFLEDPHAPYVFICLFVCLLGSSCLAGTCDGCTFHFLWESAAACPRCSQEDYHEIEGACKGGVQVTLAPPGGAALNYTRDKPSCLL